MDVRNHYSLYVYSAVLYVIILADASHILADAPHILANIVRVKFALSNIIEPDFGLLDELHRLGVLDRRQYHDVRSERRAAYRRCEALLDLLVSEDRCDKFLKALQRTDQQHVVNYIIQNGG